MFNLDMKKRGRLSRLPRGVENTELIFNNFEVLFKTMLRSYFQSLESNHGVKGNVGNVKRSGVLETSSCIGVNGVSSVQF